MLRLVVCDDDKAQIELMRDHLVRALFRLNMDMEIASHTSGAALLEAFAGGQGADIIFLDIRLGDSNGIDIAKCIREINKNVLIIFVTGRMDYIFKGYEVRAFRYIVKPVSSETVADVLLQALRELQINDTGSIRFREKGEIVRVDLADIVYFEAQNHRIQAICTGAAHCFYGRLGELETNLSDKGFVRCQKGYLVNAVHIRRIGKSDILLDNGSTIPLSSNFSKSTKDKFIMALR